LSTCARAIKSRKRAATSRSSAAGTYTSDSAAGFVVSGERSLAADDARSVATTGTAGVFRSSRNRALCSRVNAAIRSFIPVPAQPASPANIPAETAEQNSTRLTQPGEQNDVSVCRCGMFPRRVQACKKSNRVLFGSPPKAASYPPQIRSTIAARFSVFNGQCSNTVRTIRAESVGKGSQVPATILNSRPSANGPSEDLLTCNLARLPARVYEGGPASNALRYARWS
jgi:hypothetical protein